MPSFIAWRLQDKECSISLFNFNMAKSDELPKRTIEHIVALREKGLGYRKISTRLEIPISTNGDTIRRFKSCQSTASLLCSGRPCKISDCTAWNIVCNVKKDPRLTRSEHQKYFEAAGAKVYKNTIRKVLLHKGFHSRTPRKTLLLRPIHVKNCLQFDKDHLENPAKFWDSVLWSGETEDRIIW